MFVYGDSVTHIVFGSRRTREGGGRAREGHDEWRFPDLLVTVRGPKISATQNKEEGHGSLV